MNEDQDKTAVITYEEFSKGDLRTGTVTAAEKVPSSKLLKLEVSFGDLGSRTILAGIGKQFTPEEMVGKEIVCVVNMPPREMKGIMSYGMLLAAQSTDGKLSLVGAQGAQPGLRVG